MTTEPTAQAEEAAAEPTAEASAPATPKSPPVKVEPDLEFIRQVTAAGGDTMKKCYQCATCSVVCELTPDDKPFPRKEMIWASWGLKDKLAADGDVWLCHQCGDCSTNCPRGARPGDTFAAIRAYLIRNLTFPRILGTWLSEPQYLPIVFGIPFVLILLAIFSSGSLSHIDMGVVASARDVKFEEFLPHQYIYYIFITSTHLAALFLAISLVRFWKMLGTSSGNPGPAGPTQGNLVASAIAAVKEIVTHAKFKTCQESRHRYLAHLGIMYGFLLLAIGTAIEILMIIGGTELPLSQLSLPKILGHLGFLALIAGLIIVIRQRMADDESVSKASYQDWYLLLVLLAVAVTGQGLEIIRYTRIAGLAYATYFVHLIFVFSLIGYFPYSKFAHMFYRFVAILHSKYSGRDATVKEAVA
jgi:quinone-modifying oxidoreductase subunit QmoC